MAIEEKTLIRVREFRQIAALPENRERRLELIAGAIVEKIMPKPLHGLIAGIIAHLLRLYLEAHPIGYLLVEVQYEAPGEDYAPIPDLSFVSLEQPAFDWNETIPFMPALAIEIQSPDQGDRELSDKARYYLQHGSQMVWLVYPDRKLVEVLTPTERWLLTVDKMLDGGAVLPEFQVQVEKIFG